MSMYFCYYVSISLWKRTWPFIWTNLNSLHPRMLCDMFGWNWPTGSGEDDFKILSMYFCYFVIISPWKRTSPFSEQTWIPGPFTQGCFVPSLVEIGLLVLEERTKKWKFTTEDTFWSEKLTWAFSSRELKQ